MKKNLMASLALMGCFALFTITAAGQTGSATKNNQLSGITEMSVMSDSEKDPVTMISLRKDGQSYKIILTEGKITHMMIDGSKVAESDYSKYASMVSAVVDQIKKDREEAEKHRAQAAIDRKDAEKHREQAAEDRRQAELHREQATRDRAEAERHRKEAEIDREHVDVSRKRADENRAETQKNIKRAEENRRQAEIDREEAHAHRLEAEKDRALADIHRQEAEIHRAKAEEDRKVLEGILEELITDKLIKSKEDEFQVDLSADVFTVNGVKQSAALHKKYTDKFLNGGRRTVSFTSQGNNRRLRVDQR